MCSVGNSSVFCAPPQLHLLPGISDEIVLGLVWVLVGGLASESGHSKWSDWFPVPQFRVGRTAPHAGAVLVRGSDFRSWLTGRSVLPALFD